MSHENGERRQKQRFLAVRDGKACFFLALEGKRIPLVDVSLEGFSIAADPAIVTGQPFEFELRLTDIPDRIRGIAETVNQVETADGNLVGLRFVSFGGEGFMRLHEWLTVLVIANATVRITSKEAARIVEGPSLI